MEARLLSAILGVAMVQVQTAVQDLDLQKITGFWQEVGVASNQTLALKTPKRLEALFLTSSGDQLTLWDLDDGVTLVDQPSLPKTFTPPPNWHRLLELPDVDLPQSCMFSHTSGSCDMENIVGSGTDVPGKFVFPGNREIRIIDTDYKHYAILQLSLCWQGKDFHVLKYFTRSLEDEDGPGFWRFRELTTDTGLYLVARHGRCAKLLKEEMI